MTLSTLDVAAGHDAFGAQFTQLGLGDLQAALVEIDGGNAGAGLG